MSVTELSVNARVRLALEWTIATTFAVVFTDLAIEIVGAALLGYVLVFLLPFIGGALGGVPVGICQAYVLRRHLRDSGSWLLMTTIGFTAAWLVAAGIAALLFVPQQGLTSWRAFASFAVATPIVGWLQARELRRWTSQNGRWIAATAIGWSSFIAIELFFFSVLPGLNQLAGAVVSRLAGYEVASNIGAALVGSLIAGAVTGTALTVIVKPEIKN